MTRWHFLTGLLCASALFLSTAAMSAEPRLHFGGSLVTGMVGYSTHKSQLTGDQIGGGTWSISYGKVNSSGDWSAGLVLTRIETTEEFTDVERGTGKVSYARLVPAVQGRFFPTDGRLSTYLGMQLGLHLQTGSGTVDGEDFRDSNQTFAFGATAGAMFFLGSGTFLQANYVFHYFSNSQTIENNHVHSFYGGLGFQFGAR